MTRPWFVLALIAGCGAPPTAAPRPIANTPPPAATPVRPPSDALLAWPVAPFSKAQLAEVKACDLDKLAKAPPSAPHSACDHAAVAAACPGEGDPTPACVDAYRAAVKANPAFAFATQLAGRYFGKLHVVAPPPAADHALVTVVLDYKWTGYGDGVDWKLTVHDASTKPTLSVTGSKAKAVKATPDAAKAILALGSSLDSFLPIGEPLHAVDCTDNYPDWTASLELDDGEKLELATHGSNLLGLGGPWQLTVGKTTYLQMSPGFTQAVRQLVHALDLPIGEPAGMMCRGYDIGKAIFDRP
jgi:hypothetical protein